MIVDWLRKFVRRGLAPRRSLARDKGNRVAIPRWTAQKIGVDRVIRVVAEILFSQS